MRRVEAGPCPVNLNGPHSKGAKERAKAIIHHTSTSNNTAFTFGEYSEEPVKDQLIVDYSNKCAYCEASVTHTSPLDVDHFRPKGAYKGINGQVVKPGYYWLASEWTNLFPACPRCNRSSNLRLANGGKRVVGKSTHFPLVDESKRALSPGLERYEEPLLLNPNQIDVERHLEFKDGGVVIPAMLGSVESAKGAASIEIFGLHRADLVIEREKHLKRVQASIVRYKRELDPYIAAPNDQSIRIRLVEALNEIKSYLCHKQEYLTMSRQYITRQCPELTPVNGCIVGSCRCPE